jgi:hypothetical protein
MCSPPILLSLFLVVIWLTPAIAGIATLPSAGSILAVAGLFDATALLLWSCWSLPSRMAMERVAHRAAILGSACLLV